MTQLPLKIFMGVKNHYGALPSPKISAYICQCVNQLFFTAETHFLWAGWRERGECQGREWVFCAILWLPGVIKDWARRTRIGIKIFIIHLRAADTHWNKVI